MINKPSSFLLVFLILSIFSPPLIFLPPIQVARIFALFAVACSIFLMGGKLSLPSNSENLVSSCCLYLLFFGLFLKYLYEGSSSDFTQSSLAFTSLYLLLLLVSSPLKKGSLPGIAMLVANQVANKSNRKFAGLVSITLFILLSIPLFGNLAGLDFSFMLRDLNDKSLSFASMGFRYFGLIGIIGSMGSTIFISLTSIYLLLATLAFNGITLRLSSFLSFRADKLIALSAAVLVVLSALIGSSGIFTVFLYSLFFYSIKSLKKVATRFSLSKNIILSVFVFCAFYLIAFLAAAIDFRLFGLVYLFEFDSGTAFWLADVAIGQFSFYFSRAIEMISQHPVTLFLGIQSQDSLVVGTDIGYANIFALFGLIPFVGFYGFVLSKLILSLSTLYKPNLNLSSYSLLSYHIIAFASFSVLVLNIKEPYFVSTPGLVSLIFLL